MEGGPGGSVLYRQRQRRAHALRHDAVEAELRGTAVRLAQSLADVGERGAAAACGARRKRGARDPGAVVLDREQQRVAFESRRDPDRAAADLRLDAVDDRV